MKPTRLECGQYTMNQNKNHNMDSRFDIIEVDTSFSSPEYPTRVSIVDFEGNFEHAGAYSSPKFTFSVMKVMLLGWPRRGRWSCP